MKHAISIKKTALCSGLALTLIGGFIGRQGQARAQQQPPRSGNRAFNPFQVEFQQAWSAVITDPVKLIEIGQVIEDKKNNLLLMLGGKDSKDFKRQLVVTHWDGTRFVRDTSSDFLGTAQDALLAGRFRTITQPTVQPASQTPKGKKPKALPNAQIVTTEGVYNWNGSSFTRLFAAPPNLRLAIIREGSPDQMVINSGTSTIPYEAGDTDAHPSAYLLDTSDVGYARMAVGTQPFDGSKDFIPNVRFAQSFWQGRNHWQIGLQRGKPLSLPDNPDATTGDILIVYTPKLVNREKTYWKMTRYDDFEETWRSSPLPGRVLDVRVGDPKNEGHDGILVLTAENNDKERHLYFFQPVVGRIPR